MRGIFAVIVSALAALSLSGCGTDTTSTAKPAPTNDAFDAINATVAGLSPEALSDVLTYHVISGAAALSTHLTNGEILQTVFTGHNVTVDLSDPDSVVIQGETDSVKVTMPNVVCTNGVVHIVDAVLIPNGLPAPTTPSPAACTPTTCNIVEKAQQTPSLSTLVDSLISANLAVTLAGPGPFTVFAPTNDAFDAINATVAGLSPEALSDVLTYHVISGAAALSTDLTNGEILRTVFTGHNVTVDLSDPDSVVIQGETDSVKVTMPNVVCTNGVVHIVDAVLIPNGLPSVLALSV